MNYWSKILDIDNVLCIYNSKNNRYYEDGYEFFVPAEERLYVRCDTTASYETVKNIINQSSKYIIILLNMNMRYLKRKH